ncbi:MAG: patatin-like phospholipase family protein [Geminicoccaceae bacterium]
MAKADPAEKTVLVLQGGGALGAYQAGAYEALVSGGHQPGWLAGISIGAVNAAIIAGNPPELRVAKLRAFWEGITAWLAAEPWLPGRWARQLFSEAGAAAVLAAGVPGFFTPRIPPPAFMPDGSIGAISYYDTAPLVATLAELVDFDYLNDAGPRLSVGAVDIETGNFAYFDSDEMRIGPEHIMASGALPPGFPPVTIEGRHYWDGGLVSNTPLQYVLENDGATALCIFQIDLFSAEGELPENLSAVGQREKDIRYRAAPG